MLKTLTYGAMHLTVAIAVAFALTRNWHAALAIGLIEPVVQTIAYTFHERLWERFRSSKPEEKREAPDLSAREPAFSGS